jgi:feruloyl esterase
LDTILNPGQQEVLENIYRGPVNPVTGEAIYTSFPLGSEYIGSGLLLQQSVSAKSLFYQFFWLWGTNVDLLSFDFDKDVARMDSILAPILNANNPDLNPFKKKGGKLLMYTGTADPLVPFQDAVNYYDRVIAAQGSLNTTQSFFRYFLIPGMEHCGGGPGLTDFGQGLPMRSVLSEEQDILTALMSWVEKGKAPDKMIASRYKKDSNEVEASRPVFPYPQFPHYMGGDPSLPSSYNPEVHERGLVTVPADQYLR